MTVLHNDTPAAGTTPEPCQRHLDTEPAQDGRRDREPRRPAVETHDFATGRVHVAGPVGAVVTDSGLTFAVNLLQPESASYGLRCLSCTWTATAHGPAELTRHAATHARAHETCATPGELTDRAAQEVRG